MSGDTLTESAFSSEFLELNALLSGIAPHSQEGHIQVVVFKIRQLPLLVPQALLPAIPFHLPRVVLTVFLPISWVRLAPFPRTLQADLLIHRIGSHLLPMIIGAALALACGPAANLLLRMITIRLKTLSTVAATVMLHQTAPEELSR